MTVLAGEWIVYSRPDCSLCEEFQVDLADLLGAAHAAKVRVLNIDSDPALRKYSDRIPVLTVDGDFVCAIRVDRDRISRYLPNNS